MGDLDYEHLGFFYLSFIKYLHVQCLYYKIVLVSSESVPQEEEPPGPKRSARRLCKESLKSTVLESAMARKEKSNYTEEHLQFKKRKYSKPGRPKKLVSGKDQIKQTQAKPSDVRQEAETSLLSDGNISTSDSSMLESSRNAILSENMNDSVVEDTQSLSSDFDGMPKLSPMTRSSESQVKLGNSIGSPVSDDVPLADIQKPFLKPATASRPKRERGRPRGSTQAARKIAKADPYEGNVVYICVTIFFCYITVFN